MLPFAVFHGLRTQVVQEALMTRHVVVRQLLSMVIPLAAGYLIGSTRLGCWHKYDCAILNSDCELIDEGFGQKMGIINKGTVLFYPNITDMGVTLSLIHI